jgi:hypothetical protein
MRPIIVGEAGRNAGRAFDGPTGRRLAVCAGQDLAWLFRKFDPVNILDQ